MVISAYGNVAHLDKHIGNVESENDMHLVDALRLKAQLLPDSASHYPKHVPY